MLAYHHIINSLCAKSLHAPEQDLGGRAVRTDKELSISIPTWSGIFGGIEGPERATLGNTRKGVFI